MTNDVSNYVEILKGYFNSFEETVDMFKDHRNPTVREECMYLRGIVAGMLFSGKISITEMDHHNEVIWQLLNKYNAESEKNGKNYR